MTTIIAIKEIKRLNRSGKKILKAIQSVDFTSADGVKLDSIKMRGELGWRKV